MPPDTKEFESASSERVLYQVATLISHCAANAVGWRRLRSTPSPSRSLVAAPSPALCSTRPRSLDHACWGTWFARPCVPSTSPVGKAGRPMVPLDAAAALAMGLSVPRGPGGQAWYFSRAELPHSLRFQKSLSPSLLSELRRSQREFGPSSSARSARRRVGWLLAAPQHRGVLRSVGWCSVHSTVRPW